MSSATIYNLFVKCTCALSPVALSASAAASTAWAQPANDLAAKERKDKNKTRFHEKKRFTIQRLCYCY